VTYADENWQQLYVQDNKTGMFLDMQGIPFPLPLPEVVLLEGRTVLTNGFRRIENLSVQPLEGVGRPLMRNVLRASDLYLPGYGSILVRVRGVVTSFVEEDRLALRLDMDGTPVVAYVKNYRRSDLEGLLGARVHMEVVCSQQFGKDMRVERVWLLAGGWRDIHVDVPGVQDPFDAIPRDIAELQGTNAVRFLDSRVQVHGIVSSWQVADWIDVSDGTGTIRANIPFITINPMGSKYEVCGALKKAEDGSLYLDAALARELDPVAQSNSFDLSLYMTNVHSRIEDVRNLSRQKAKQNLPVRVKGFVTLHDELWQNLFIFDGTNGVYVEALVLGRLKPGMWLDVAGVTKPGDWFPFVGSADVRVVGARNLPVPEKVTFEEASRGSNDCQWCQLSGIVQEVRENDGRLYVNVETEQGGVFICWLAHVNNTNYVKTLPGAAVVVQGVCVNQISKTGQLTGFIMRLHDESFIIRQGGSKEMECSIADINRLIPATVGNSLFKVRGIVSLVDSRSFYLQDKSGGIRVCPMRHAGMPKVGDCLEVAGMRSVQNYSAFLNAASFAPSDLPYRMVPRKVRGQNLFSGECGGELVTIKAQVLERVSPGGEPKFFVQEGRLIFQAQGAFPLADVSGIKEGAIVSLTGVCDVARISAIEIKSCRLLLRSPRDIQVVWRPPEGWDWQRFFWVLGLLTLVLLAGVFWVLMLRRQVRLQTQQISDRLEREAALEARLLQAQKMESIGQLAAGVAHDFNNLLTVIEGYAAMLEADSSIVKESRNSLGAIIHASHRAAELTQQLLAFSRQQPLKLQMLDINDVLAAVSKLFAGLLTESIKLTTVMASDLPLVRGDPGMIQQVMMNLLVNARDAMPNGGLLEIQTAHVTLSGESVSMPGRVGEFVRVTVRDNGVGMSPDVQRRIFEPFFTTKDVGKGTGLGLATVHGIVQQHGGWVDVSSAVGQGTAFEVYLPAFRPKSEPASASPTEEIEPGPTQG
jgi:signal transduction histidine kinase